MLKTLYIRLTLGLLLLLLAVGLLYTFITVYTLRDYSASVNQALHRDLAKNLILDRNLVNEGQLDNQALEDVFALYMTINPSIEVYRLDLEGRILSYSADPAKIKRQQVSLQPIQQLLNDASRYPLLGDDPRSLMQQKVFSVAALPSAENPSGYLYVVLRGEEYDAAETIARSSQMLELSLWALLASLAVVMIAGLAVFRLLTRRLTELTQLVEAFENSDMRQQPHTTWREKHPKVRDEIDYLGMTFDNMARRIASQIEQLTEKDSQRRQWIAQVSHDLRTPLASMQGYIESLQLRRERLSQQEQARFLDIAHKEGQRLSHLVDELFELAALDAREKQPVAEAFPLAEWVHDVVQKHQQAAQEKQLTLCVSGALDVPNAYGDLAMTERVLDNLINNAIAYSPAGRSIDLCLSQDKGRPSVCVCDTGPGIPEKDLPFIFDPFYRGETSAEGHAGLGLAIARRIMVLQKGEITVANRRDGGACFCISLPASSV